MIKRITLFLIMACWLGISLAAYQGVAQSNSVAAVSEKTVDDDKTFTQSFIQEKDYMSYLTSGLQGAELIKTVEIDPLKKIYLIYMPEPDHYLIMRIHRSPTGELLNAKSTVVGKNYMVNMNMLYEDKEDDWKL